MVVGGFFSPFPRENLVKTASFGRKAGLARLPTRRPHRSGFHPSPQAWTRTCITEVARFPSPGLQTPDPMCAPPASARAVGAAGFCFVVFSLFPLTSDFELSRGELAPLLFLTVVQLSFFANAVSSAAGRNRPPLVRLCACFVPRVPGLCGGRLGGSRRRHWGFSSLLPRPGSARLRRAAPG